ncbi:hypothetical protein JD78_03607 [Modestobacter roseus]|uniref:Uncharacterized protein n=2 Tax=Modestobacter roseus TaxID=1181884 RepID=A0A562IW33_9ACTN|nr:hypothetical protein JD78_03607 [Modestobacter roseus]
MSLAVAAMALAGCADAPGTPQSPGDPSVPPGLVLVEPMPEEPPALPETLPPELLEELALPPVSMDVYGLIERVRAAAGNSPDFGDVEIGRDRTQLIVRWHGRLPAAVQAVVDDPGVPEIEVVVEQTRFPVGELRAEASRLIGAHPDLIAGIGARPAGDGLDVLVRTSAVDAAGGADEALARGGVTSRFPLFAEAGEIVPGLTPLRGRQAAAGP